MGSDPEEVSLDPEDFLRRYGFDGPGLIAAHNLAKFMAQDIVRERMSMFQDLVDLVSPLLEVGLSPMDVIVSVAVEGPDGSVRIVSLKGDR